LHRPGENGHFLVIITQDLKKIILDYDYNTGTYVSYVTSLSENQDPLDVGILPGFGYFTLTCDYSNSKRIEYISYQTGFNKTVATSFGNPTTMGFAKVFSDSSANPNIVFYNNGTTLMCCENKNEVWKQEKGIFSLASAYLYTIIQDDKKFHILQADGADSYKFYSFKFDDNINAYRQNISVSSLNLNLDSTCFLDCYRLQYPSAESDFLVLHQDKNTPKIYLLFFKDYNR
jgi:hypothetical protein